MKMVRMVLAAFVLASLSSAASAADEKVDVKKLIVGKWEATKADEGSLPVGTIVEFTADGKIKVGVKDQSFEGTYTVEGSAFTYKMKIGDVERAQKITIKSISDKELDTTNPDNKKVTFKKVK